MRTASSVVLSLSVALALASCGGSPSGGGTTPRAVGPSEIVPSEVPAAEPGDARGFARAMNGFGLDVWRALAAEGEAEGNFAISPASLSLALAMTYGGARGQTAEAMARALHLASSPDQAMADAGALISTWNDPQRTAYELAIANRLFAEQRYDFREAYLAATRDRFGAEVERLDFRGDAEGARQTINGWVEERTRDRIQDLLPEGSIADDTRLVLVNAVYFHGRWLREFDPEQTTDRSFFVHGREQAQVPTMHAVGGRYGEDEGVQLLELPYAGEELAMLIVLPRQRDGIAALEERLDEAQVAQWAERVAEHRRVEILLPRFRVETDSLALREPLVALGMGVAFSDRADFSAMTEPHETPLKIDEVFHRVFVEVNEEGTEAAAATGVVMVEITSAGPRAEPPRFVADHPFLFFLRDQRTGAILFAGRVSDPRA